MSIKNERRKDFLNLLMERYLVVLEILMDVQDQLPCIHIFFSSTSVSMQSI